MQSLKLARLLRKISQMEVCRAVGVSQPRLSLAERGIVTLKRAEISKIAKLLRVAPSELFDEEQGLRRGKAEG